MNATMQGLIDAECKRARLDERVRLAGVLAKWVADGTVEDTADVRLIRDRLLATDY